MKTQSAPAIATWFLKLFCSSAGDEFLIGDLFEKYLQGHGRFWYWRQVTAIVSLRLYRNARQLSLSTTAIQIRRSFPVLLVIAAISAVLMSDIWMILPVGVIGGVIVAGLIFLHGRGANRLTTSGAVLTADHPLSNHPGISMHHIPVEGAVGVLFVCGTVFVFVVGIPAIREIFLLTAPLAALALGILLYWHKHHGVKIEPLSLHK